MAGTRVERTSPADNVSCNIYSELAYTACHPAFPTSILSLMSWEIAGTQPYKIRAKIDFVPDLSATIPVLTVSDLIYSRKKEKKRKTCYVFYMAGTRVERAVRRIYCMGPLNCEPMHAACYPAFPASLLTPISSGQFCKTAEQAAINQGRG
jgi:hypothetical protein